MKEKNRGFLFASSDFSFPIKSRHQAEIQIHLASYPRYVITFLMVCLGHIILVAKIQ